MSSRLEVSEKMGPSTPRVARLREAGLRLQAAPGLWDWGAEDFVLGAESYRRSEGEPWVIRRAKAAADMLRHMPTIIREDELLAGTFRWQQLPPEEERREEAAAYRARHLGDRGKIVNSDHMAIDNERLLRLGVRGLLSEIDRHERQLNNACPNVGATLCGRPGQPHRAAPTVDDRRRRAFYKAARIALEGLLEFASRYADEAARLAAQEKDSARRGELEEIARICRKVPAQPAATFHEALQSAWLVFLALRLVRFGLMCPGRPDQYLLPYYRADLEAGRLSRENALELLECYFIKQNEFGMGPQGCMVGGVDRRGRDATNELSYLCLEAMEGLRLVNPALAIDWYPSTPDPLLRKGCEMLAQGVSHPAIFNGALIAEGLQQAGLSPEDSRDHIHSTCVEMTPIGKSNVWVAHPYVNLAKMLELALHNGLDPVTGEQRGPRTGELARLTTFERLVRAYLRQLRHRVRENCRDYNKTRRDTARSGPSPLLSCFVADCLEKGRDITAGGARYNHIYTHAVGTANVVDALLVIKKFVFERRELTLEEVVRMCDANFSGQEKWRQKFLSEAPKWGNDLEQPDELAVRLCQAWYDEVTKHKCVLGDSFRPGLLCWQMHGRLGKETGATPDGRPAFQALADSMGAAQGRDLAGPTALIRSVTKLDFRPANGGMVLNLKFTPDLLKGEAGLDKLFALLKTYLSLGGFQVQVNVVGKETLLEAREHPELHQGLIVRVGGFSEYFCRLDPVIQEEIIARTEHA